MSKIKNRDLTQQNLEFIEEFSNLLLPWGMPANVGRIYGCLLLQEQPMSLDDLCQHLGFAKSTASVAARELERAHLIQRLGVKGSKKILYRVNQKHGGLIHDKVHMLSGLVAMLVSHKDKTSSKVAAERLQSMADYCEQLQVILMRAMAELNVSREK